MVRGNLYMLLTFPWGLTYLKMKMLLHRTKTERGLTHLTDLQAPAIPTIPGWVLPRSASIFSSFSLPKSLSSRLSDLQLCSLRLASETQIFFFFLHYTGIQLSTPSSSPSRPSLEAEVDSTPTPKATNQNLFPNDYYLTHLMLFLSLITRCCNTNQPWNSGANKVYCSHIWGIQLGISAYLGWACSHIWKP